MSAAAPVVLSSTRYQIINEVEVREERRVLAPFLPRELISIINGYRDVTREGEVREGGAVMDRWVIYVTRPTLEFFVIANMTELFQLALSNQPGLVDARKKFQFAMGQFRKVEMEFHSLDVLALSRPDPRQPSDAYHWFDVMEHLHRLIGNISKSTVMLQDEKGQFLTKE